jgi:hypothetical protein
MWRGIKLLSAQARGNKSAKGMLGPNGRAAAVFKWPLSANVIVAFLIMSSCSKTSEGCEQGMVKCGDSCTDTASDVYNCGSCGNACMQTLVCSLGACKAQCDPGLKNCADSCIPMNASCSSRAIGGGAGSGTSTSGIITGGGGNTAVITGTGGSTATSTTTSGNAGSTTTTTSGGTAGTGAGGTSSTPSGDGGSNVGGYIISGDWHGYAFTYAKGGTITPKDFSSSMDFPLCASGSVDPDSSYASLAMIGWNINQATTANAPTESVTPKKKAIAVSLTNKGGSPLRIQIQGPNGGTSATDRWCAALPSGGGSVAYSTFNTECWEGGKGTAYASQPIVSVMVLVPGTSASAVSFDFCITKIAESD